MGMPPRIAFEPSSLAAVEMKSCSLPEARVQEVTVAPKRSMVTVSREGRVALTVWSETSTTGWGREGEMGMVEGLFLRSMVGGGEACT